MTYSLNDICLTPAKISRVEHRGDCNPYNVDQMLPLFTAPMNSIVDENNYETFLKNKINTIIPRGVDYGKRLELSTKTFVALGLDEFESFISDCPTTPDSVDCTYYICVDVANGHMKRLIDLCSKAKVAFGSHLILMAGNIANPETYADYAIAGVDFIRVGIGGGSVCLTSANGGVHYGMGSLIKHVADKSYAVREIIRSSLAMGLSCPYRSVPLIVADGGFDNYDKIIKALALGADYVMIGKLFAQCEEACGKILTYTRTSDQPLDKELKWLFDSKHEIYQAKFRHYYGMSTKKAQVETGRTKLRTSEGIKVNVPILYSLEAWCENFIDYLRTAMSYTDSFNLDEFKETEYTIISPLEYLSYYK